MIKSFNALCIVQTLHSTFTLPDVLFLQFVVAFFFPVFNKCMLCISVCALNFMPHSVVMVTQKKAHLAAMITKYSIFRQVCSLTGIKYIKSQIMAYICTHF